MQREEVNIKRKAEIGVMQPQAKVSQWMPGFYQKLEEARNLLSLRFQREHGPVDMLISDFQLPEL